MLEDNKLKVGLAQISPVWLNKQKTIEKTKNFIIQAAEQYCELIVFKDKILMPLDITHAPMVPNW